MKDESMAEDDAKVTPKEKRKAQLQAQKTAVKALGKRLSWDSSWELKPNITNKLWASVGLETAARVASIQEVNDYLSFSKIPSM